MPTGTPTAGATPTQTVPLASITIPFPGGIAGSGFYVTGRVARGATGVRILWDDGSLLRALGDGPAERDGSYGLELRVPNDAPAGDAQVCAMASGPGAIGRDIACTPFTVFLATPGSLAGRVLDARADPVAGAVVLLTTDGDLPVARTTTDFDGHYSFGELPPGAYVVRVVVTGLYFTPQAKTVRTGSQMLLLHTPADASGVPDIVLFQSGAIALLPERAYVKAVPGSPTFARFGSLPGGPPLLVRFYATVLFLRTPPGAVLFSIRQGDVPLASQVRLAPGRVLDEAPFDSLADSYFADFNVSELPAGDLTLRISRYDTIRGAEVETIDELPVQMVDLAGRWLSGRVKSPTVSIAADSLTRVVYSFTGFLPHPSFAFDFHQNIDLDFGSAPLENHASLGTVVDEAYSTDDTWSGRATAQTDLQLLGYDLESDGAHPYAGPRGDAFADTTYHFDPPLAASPLPQQCAAVPALSFEYGYSLDACPFDCTIGVGARAGLLMCAEVVAQTQSTIESDLKFTAQVVPDVTALGPIKVDLDAVVCNADADLTPQAHASLQISYDPDLGACPSECARFDDPCLDLTAAAHYRVSCLSVVLNKGDLGLGHIKYGCAGSQATPAPTGAATSDEGTDDQHKDVAVATDGAGHALAVWKQNDSQDPTNPAFHIYYTSYDGIGWTAAQRLSEAPALIESPKVIFLGPNQALAVWAQSKLTFAQASGADQGRLVSSSDLYYARWDGQAWSAPVAITSDDVLDSKPVLAADPRNGTGTALLVWLRANQASGSQQQPIGLYYAAFDGTVWGAPALIDPGSTALDRQPAIAFDSHGTAWAAWVRDIDRDVATSEDRQIVLSAFTGQSWTLPQTIPGLPAGAYTPALAFDGNDNPLIVFVVPATAPDTGRLGTGDGNNSQLFAGRRVAGIWQITTVGDTTYAERPVVRVNANQAIIMYRQFGTAMDVHLTGDLAAAVADLSAPTLQWTTGFLTADGLTNWQVAFDTDSQNDKNFVFTVKQVGSGTAAVGRMRAGGHVGGRTSATVLSAGDSAVTSLVVPFAPDLAVTANDVALSNPHPLIGDTVTITATIHNLGLEATAERTPTDVGFYDGDTLIGRQPLQSRIPFNGAAPVSITYTPQRGGLHTIRVVVDEANVVGESDETNNAAQVILGQPPAPVNISGFVIPARGHKPTVQWDAPHTAGISRYRVYRSTNSGTGYELVGGTTATSFVDEVAATGTTYYYVIAAIDAYGVSSAFSNEAKLAAAAAACPGDCNRDGTVSVDELVRGVNIALGNLPLDTCSALNVDGGATISIDEILAAVHRALHGCANP